MTAVAANYNMTNKMTQVPANSMDEHNRRAGTNLVFVAVAGGLKLTVQIKPIDLCVPGVISVDFYALVILARDGREINEDSALVLDVTNPMLRFRELLFWAKVPIGPIFN
ncbi:hypothetical protein ACH5RR_014700 [Cinchona calisaya]|uniref:Uncharacterized protein n=1 Tax=Cinchona calisaya TaxID=153742 RepID=A0ABD2ZR17_9GENT